MRNDMNTTATEKKINKTHRKWWKDLDFQDRQNDYL